jgi:hypothetical protein
MRKCAVLVAGLAALVPGVAAAQFGRQAQLEAAAYARARENCGYRYDEGLRQCRPGQQCTERLDRQRQQCIATVEQRYQRSLRLLMRQRF